jgi:hypothetical protein
MQLIIAILAIFGLAFTGEHRTKFMLYSEMLSMISLALEKKRLRVPITL